MKILLELNALDATDQDQAGAKGASLARLAREGFRVPPGLVLTAEAYRNHLAAIPGFARTAGEAALLTSDDERAMACRALREAIQGRPLPEAVEALLRERLPDLLIEGPVVLRVSTTSEARAGRGASARRRGGYEAVINLTSVEDIVREVRRAWASIWSEDLLARRAAAGQGWDEPAVALIIQRLVASAVAGRAFTLQPETAHPDHALVESAYGLGANLRADGREIDRFVIHKQSGLSVEERIGDKQRAIVATTVGTALVPVESRRAQTPSLGATHLGMLARLCRDLEARRGFPQEIDWAVAGGELFVLQARPIRELPERWTRDAFAERFPRPVTPLSWTMAREGFEASLDYALGLMDLPPFDGPWFERHQGYVYANDTAMRLYFRAGRLRFESLDDLRARVPEMRQRYAWVQRLPDLWARDLDRFLVRLGRLEDIDQSAMSDAGLWSHARAIQALGIDYAQPNIALTITHRMLHGMLMALIRALVDGEHAAGLYADLTCFGETRSQMVNRELFELYRMASEDPDLTALLLEQDRRRIWEEDRLAAFPSFARRFAELLADHGHREVGCDLYHPTWVGQPWIILEHLRLMLERERAGGSVDPPARREQALRVRQGQAEARFFALVPADLRYFATELLRLTRLYTALDDLERYQTSRLAPPLRQALVSLGRRMFRRGALETPSDVFFLFPDEIEGWLEGDGDALDLRETASERKAEYDAQHRLQPPRVIEPRKVAKGDAAQRELPGLQVTDETRALPIVDGRVGRFAISSSATSAPEDERTLRGLPGSPGVAEGPVYLVDDALDLAGVPAGAVLVARSTTPAWTPLFFSASAIVVESGGPLSHGAVTAREIGLPAVMSLRDALSSLGNGERVRVDGRAGTVQRMAGDDAGEGEWESESEPEPKSETESEPKSEPEPKSETESERELELNKNQD